MRYIIPLFLLIIGSCSFEQRWSDKDIAIWETCIVRKDFTSKNTEYQRALFWAPLQEGWVGTKVSFIGKVVDVKFNPMNGVYIILESPINDTGTNVYAYIPEHYGHRPFPEEMMKGDIIEVAAKYNIFCDVAKDRYIHDVVVESFYRIPATGE